MKWSARARVRFHLPVSDLEGIFDNSDSVFRSHSCRLGLGLGLV